MSAFIFIGATAIFLFFVQMTLMIISRHNRAKFEVEAAIKRIETVEYCKRMQTSNEHTRQGAIEIVEALRSLTPGDNKP